MSQDKTDVVLDEALKPGSEIELDDEEPTYSGNLDYRGIEPDMGRPDEVIYGFDNRHRLR